MKTAVERADERIASLYTELKVLDMKAHANDSGPPEAVIYFETFEYKRRQLLEKIHSAEYEKEFAEERRLYHRSWCFDVGWSLLWLALLLHYGVNLDWAAAFGIGLLVAMGYRLLWETQDTAKRCFNLLIDQEARHQSEQEGIPFIAAKKRWIRDMFYR